MQKTQSNKNIDNTNYKQKLLFLTLLIATLPTFEVLEVRHSNLGICCLIQLTLIETRQKLIWGNS